MTELDEENHRYIACSRRSVIVGSGAKYKGARKNKSEGGGEVREGTPAPLSPVPLYFSSLSLLRTALHYLNAWNRLIALFPLVCCFYFVRAFSFQGHTKIALSDNFS